MLRTGKGTNADIWLIPDSVKFNLAACCVLVSAWPGPVERLITILVVLFCKSAELTAGAVAWTDKFVRSVCGTRRVNARFVTPSLDEMVMGTKLLWPLWTFVMPMARSR